MHMVRQLDVGGMEKLLVEFARHADRDRFDLHFLSLTTRGPVAEELDALGWPVTVLDEPAGLRPGLVFRLAGLLRRWRADVVHTHNSGPLIYGGPAARLARVRTVIASRHGQSFGASARKNALFRLASVLADRVVCVSRDSAELSAGRGIAPRKLLTIWNGIDTGRFAYAGVHPGRPAVMVGRLVPEKDVATLLRAVREVVRQEPSFRLEVAGGGVCAPELHRLAGELNLGQHVRFLGERKDVPAVLAGASLFVLPSLTEGVSLTLLEAMGRGLPVVATRVGGNREVVVDGVTGLLVPPADPGALAAALLRVYRETEFAHRLGLAGRERVERHFDVRGMVAAYERLYLGGDPVRPALSLALPD
jgi:glycosyltransferase involved in cell wall biosynthesis